MNYWKKLKNLFKKENDSQKLHSEESMSLRSLIKFYMRRAAEIEGHLISHPDDWGKFQPEFNKQVDGIFRNIMEFEKLHLEEGEDTKVYKLKQMFIERFRPIFCQGEYCKNIGIRFKVLVVRF